MTSAREWLPPLMIVDDDPNDIALMRHAFDRAGVRNPILAFTDSQEALNFLRALLDGPETALLMPAVLFLDIKMPKVHGFVLLKWIRHQPPFDDMKIVVVSGSEDPQDRERAAKLGADSYAVKAPGSAVFVRLVIQHCGEPTATR